MMLTKKTLSRAPAAMRSGLPLRINQVRELETKPSTWADLNRYDPLKRPMKDLCWKAMPSTEFKCRSDAEFSAAAFLDAQRRCLCPCASAVPPSDLTLYKPSDKLNRHYQRTWCECEVEERKRKAICTCRPVTFPRRPRRTPPLEKVCADGSESLGLGSCRPKKAPTTCPRFKLPFCKEVRKIRCGPYRPHAGCIRPRTKYPSFSECHRDPLPEVPPPCFCINQPAMCEVWNYYRMRKS
ncbi:uncharacterized protein LOC108090374 [Drosophila ficusphila]|uniref:uncharacterized protein LOC108090374 n=1 Tax=Drosophila ficusphila TaxID=30025 RepID=UPI0007E614D5|nr:uncharacterized protein LOC108090374 [Drosophila ficusphila]